MKQFIIKQLANDAGSLKIAIAGIITFFVSKPFINDWIDLSDSEALAFGIASGTGVAWILSTISAYYNQSGVKEIQENLNRASVNATTVPLTVDGSAGRETVKSSAKAADLAAEKS